MQPRCHRYQLRISCRPVHLPALPERRHLRQLRYPLRLPMSLRHHGNQLPDHHRQLPVSALHERWDLFHAHLRHLQMPMPIRLHRPSLRVTHFLVSQWPLPEQGDLHRYHDPARLPMPMHCRIHRPTMRDQHKRVSIQPLL